MHRNKGVLFELQGTELESKMMRRQIRRDFKINQKCRTDDSLMGRHLRVKMNVLNVSSLLFSEKTVILSDRD